MTLLIWSAMKLAARPEKAVQLAEPSLRTLRISFLFFKKICFNFNNFKRGINVKAAVFSDTNYSDLKETLSQSDRMCMQMNLSPVLLVRKASI